MHLKTLAIGLAGLALLTGGGYAQDAVPTENTGVSAQMLGELPLAPEFEQSGSRKFRMRIITVEPGGVIGMHSHANRPSVEYVLSGNAVEVRGDASNQMMAGSQMLADHTVEHYWRNTGDDPLVILAVDIYEPQP